MALESLQAKSAGVSDYLFAWLGNLLRIVNALDTRVQTSAAVTYANRPSPAVEGMLVVISDSNTNAWAATIAGGGANRVLGYYNGTNWTVAAR